MTTYAYRPNPGPKTTEAARLLADVFEIRFKDAQNPLFLHDYLAAIEREAATLALDNMAKSLHIAREAWDENTALSEAAEGNRA